MTPRLWRYAILTVDDKTQIHHLTCSQQVTLVVEWPQKEAIRLSDILGDVDKHHVKYHSEGETG